MKPLFSARLVAACVLAVSFSLTPVFAASDFLLELDGIRGESRKKPGAFDILAYSYDVKSPRDSASGQATGKRQASDDGGSTGDKPEKANFSDISFSCPSSNSSTELMRACATGKHIPRATLTCRKTGGDGNPYTYMKVEFKDVVVSNWQSAASPTDDPLTDGFTLNFSEVQFQCSFNGEDPPLVVKFVVKK